MWHGSSFSALALGMAAWQHQRFEPSGRGPEQQSPPAALQMWGWQPLHVFMVKAKPALSGEFLALAFPAGQFCHAPLQHFGWEGGSPGRFLQGCFCRQSFTAFRKRKGPRSRSIRSGSSLLDRTLGGRESVRVGGSNSCTCIARLAQPGLRGHQNSSGLADRFTFQKAEEEIGSPKSDPRQQERAC